MTSTASAPASSANLGPGFDVLAVALSLRCTVDARRSKDWQIDSPGLDDHAGSFRRIHQVAEELGVQGPWSLTVRSEIPLSAGLGSSAAFSLAAAGAMATEAGLEVTTDELVDAVASVEGHPDNVTAAGHGGLVAVRPDGSWHRLGISPDLNILVALPNERLATEAARRVLPTDVSRSVATRTVARAILLIEALRTGSTVPGSTAGDEMHEEPRSGLSPVTGQLVSGAFEAGAVHASWSGAGPAAIAFVGDAGVHDVRRALEEGVGAGGTVLELDVDTTGLVRS